MSTDTLAIKLGNLRATDSNSLLRMYDQAQAILHASGSQQERARADKAVQRITRVLQKRKISI